MAVVIDEMEVVPREGERTPEAPEKAGPGAKGSDVAGQVEKVARDLSRRAERLRAF